MVQGDIKQPLHVDNKLFEAQTDVFEGLMVPPMFLSRTY